MLSLLRKVLGLKNQSASKFSDPRSRFSRPLLERLEDRIVPDAMYWKNTVGDNLWSTKGNWYDQTTGAVATRSPGATDTAYFDGNGPSNCFLTGNVTIEGLNSTSGWNGKMLILAGNDINLQGSVSLGVWNGGVIMNNSDVKASHLNIYGGIFEYSTTSSISNSLNNGGNKLYITISGVSGSPGELVIGGTTGTINAVMDVGYDSTGAEGLGSLYFNSTNGFPDVTQATYVSSQGVVSVDTDVWIKTADFTSYGIVNMANGSKWNLATSTAKINGGIMDVEQSSGTSTINGDITFDNSTLVTGEFGGYYGNLVVNGTLSLLDGSTLHCLVNANSLTQCSNVTASDVIVDGTDNIEVDTVGNILTGAHDHDILDSTMAPISGTLIFNMYYNNGVSWTMNFDIGDYYIYLNNPV